MTPALVIERGTFLEASAGTGKTTALVEAIATAIAEGVPVHRLVAVTFTHQAAGEMKLRVRQKLGDLGTRSSHCRAVPGPGLHRDHSWVLRSLIAAAAH